MSRTVKRSVLVDGQWYYPGDDMSDATAKKVNNPHVFNEGLVEEDDTPEEVADLLKLKKDELVALAEETEVEIDSKATKDEIAYALYEAGVEAPEED